MRVPFASLFRKNTDTSPAPRAHTKRKHPRLPFSDSALLCWTDDAGAPHVAVATLIDASPGGMALRLSEPVAISTRVWILLKDGTDGRGEVRYCQPMEPGYRAGIRFVAEERSGRAKPGDNGNVLEWIDSSDRLVGSFVSIRNAKAGEIEVVVPEVVPCPAIVMLSGNDIRCLGCTRDWWPAGDSYCLRVEVISNPLPNSRTA